MRFLTFFAAFLILTSGLAHAGLEEGRRAYMKENWLGALQNLRPLAEEGNDEALLLLGNMYNDGKGVEQNHTVALAHYKQAVAAGNDNAMLAIATMYAQGLGVEKDMETSFTWFQQAANAGNPAAQLMLGSFYLKGHDDIPTVDADLVKSYGWFRIAARQDRLPERQADRIRWCGKRSRRRQGIVAWRGAGLDGRTSAAGADRRWARRT